MKEIEKIVIDGEEVTLTQYAKKEDIEELTRETIQKAKDSGEFDGADGVGIVTLEQTTTSSVSGGINEITATLTNGETKKFTFRNGSMGTTGERGRGIYLYNGQFSNTSTLASEPNGGSGLPYVISQILEVNNTTINLNEIVIDVYGNVGLITAISIETNTFDCTVYTNITGPQGESGSLNAETWTFTLADGSTAEKKVALI